MEEERSFDKSTVERSRLKVKAVEIYGVDSNYTSLEVIFLGQGDSQDTRRDKNRGDSPRAETDKQ